MALGLDKKKIVLFYAAFRFLVSQTILHFSPNKIMICSGYFNSAIKLLQSVYLSPHKFDVISLY